uniref:Uncharacterized protein n=1 Tax=Arundo donax TaxID=35708 RepID=A0A0A8Y758_ARUDO
MMARRGSA